MEKTEENKEKDRQRIGNRVWKPIPSTLDRRTTGSGVRFEGEYVRKNSR